MALKDVEKCPIPELDLRRLCRRDHGAETHVYVEYGYRMHPWLTLYDADIEKRRDSWVLTARLRDAATDVEHASAHVLSVPLVGVEFTGLYWGCTHFSAWVGGAPEDVDDFRFPVPTYDPFKAARLGGKNLHCSGRVCHSKPHIIAPYLPPANPVAFHQVRGRRLDIRVVKKIKR
jgi:hypothetical protein